MTATFHQNNVSFKGYNTVSQNRYNSSHNFFIPSDRELSRDVLSFAGELFHSLQNPTHDNRTTVAVLFRRVSDKLLPDEMISLSDAWSAANLDSNDDQVLNELEDVIRQIEKRASHGTNF